MSGTQSAEQPGAPQTDAHDTSAQVEPRRVNILTAWGESEKTLAELIQALLSHSPKAVWCEPTPQRERIDGFVGLWIDNLSNLREHLNGGISLDEARLFWPDGWVHIVATDAKGCRWAAFRIEPPNSASPATEPPWGGALGGPVNWQIPEELKQLIRRGRDVLTVRDLRRYGLEQYSGRMPGDLRIIEFYAGTERVLWRLEV